MRRPVTLDLAQRLNALGAIVAALVIAGAWYFEFSTHEAPCPFCLMIRICFTGIAIGALLNVRFGVRVAHYGLCLLFAVVGMVICFYDVVSSYPPISSWGSTPFMGLHLPTWGFISFAAAAALLGAVMFWEAQFRGTPADTESTPTPWRYLGYAAFALIAVITAGNIIIGYTVCGASLTCAG
ncbi:MAG: disulfide bond formation protein B [Candidatus Nanopelagicales bacterium]